MNISLNELTEIEFDGIDMADSPDFCDAYVVSAKWKDTEIELTDDELDNIDTAEVSERAMQIAVGS